MTEKELISQTEAAQMLGVALSTVERWIKAGKLAGYEYKTRIMVKLADVEELLTPKRINPNK